MKPTRIVLLLVALIAGGIAAFLATRGGDPQVQVVEGPQVVVEEEKTRILVAIAPIGVGQRLSDEVVQWAEWPAGAMRGEYIAEEASPEALEQVTGAIARFEIFPGDPVTEAKLVRAEQGYLSAVLEKGMRGVSVPVMADAASGGFIVPNDRVDVVLTSQSGGSQVSRTILSNIKVLAIGKRLGETGTTGAPSNPEDPRAEVFSDETIATLELDPAQAEEIINARRLGALSLALRSMADFDEVAPTRELARRNQPIRVIKFGQTMSVTPNQGGEATGEPDAAVAPAAFSEPDPIASPEPADVVAPPVE